MQQNYEIAVYGSVVYRHAPGSTAARPKIFHESFINLTEIREQTAEAANHMLASVMQDAAVAKSGTLRLFSDCGPHFRSGANLAHYADPCVQRSSRFTFHIGVSSTENQFWMEHLEHWEHGSVRCRCSSQS